MGPLQNPIEIGETQENVVAKLNHIAGYRARFQAVFGRPGINIDNVAKTIATFERNLGVGTDKPNPDAGRFAVTKDPADWGRFKTPTLRDLSKTAPYMHDGSLGEPKRMLCVKN